MHKTLGVFAAALVTMALCAAPAHASSISFKGVTWDTNNGGVAGTMSIVSGNLIMHATQNGTASNVYLAAGIGINESESSAPTLNPFGTGTRWMVSTSFIDRQNSNGTWPIIDISFNGSGGSSRNWRGVIGAGGMVDSGTSFRLEAGAQTSNQIGNGTFGQTTVPIPNGNAYLGLYSDDRFSPLPGDTAAGITGPTKRNAIYAVTAGSAKATASGNSLAAAGYGTLAVRVDGTPVTVTIGKCANNVMEVKWQYGSDAYIYTNSFFKNSAAAIDAANGDSLATTDLTNSRMDQIEYRVLGTVSGNDYTFTNLITASNYTSQIPEPASIGLMALGSMLMLARRRKTA